MSTRIFKVKSHNGPGGYRVTKWSNGVVRCTCSNFIYNRGLAKYTGDKHFLDVDDAADNVEEITNPTMIRFLEELEKLAEAVELRQETYMYRLQVQDQYPNTTSNVFPVDVAFLRLIKVARGLEGLSLQDYEYVVNEATAAATFWIRWDQKYQEVNAKSHTPEAKQEFGKCPVCGKENAVLVEGKCGSCYVTNNPPKKTGVYIL